MENKMEMEMEHEPYYSKKRKKNSLTQGPFILMTSPGRWWNAARRSYTNKEYGSNRGGAESCMLGKGESPKIIVIKCIEGIDNSEINFVH